MPFVSMAYAVAGQTALSAEYNKVVDNVTYLNGTGKGIVAYGSRPTASSNSTGADVAVLRVNAAVENGRMYRVHTGTIHPNSSVSTDNIRTTLRFTTSGNATASSGILPGGLAFVQFGGIGYLSTSYKATGNVTLSVVLCVGRATGSGNCNLYADGDRLTELYIEDLGLSVSDTGVDL
jgi:hypothetical protein